MPDQLTTLEGHTEGPIVRRMRFDLYAECGTYLGTTRGNNPLPEGVARIDEANAILWQHAPDLLAIANELADRLTIAGLAPVAAEAFLRRGIKPPALTWRETTGRDGE